MSSFEHDMILQEYVDIIAGEDKIDELIGICDYYHHKLPNLQASFEWGLHLGTYMGKFRIDQKIFRFVVPNDKETVVFFIGDYDFIKSKIVAIL